MESQDQLDVISILKSFKTNPFYEQWKRLHAEIRGEENVNFFFTFISKTLIDDLRAKYGEKEIETTLAVPYPAPLRILASERGKTRFDYAFLIPVSVEKDLVIDNRMYIMKDVALLRFIDYHDTIKAVWLSEQKIIKERYPELVEYINSPNMVKYFRDVDDAISLDIKSSVQRLVEGIEGGQTRRLLELSLVFKNTDGKFYEYRFSTRSLLRYHSRTLMVVKGRLDLW